MSEYIFRYASGYGWNPGEYEHENDIDHYGTLHEEIVRCRDCRYESYGECTRPDETYDEHWFPVEPEGFCKWGVPRETADPTCDECGMRCIEKYEAGCPREER